MARSEGEPGARKGNFATYGLDARGGEEGIIAGEMIIERIATNRAYYI